MKSNLYVTLSIVALLFAVAGCQPADEPQVSPAETAEAMPEPVEVEPEPTVAAAELMAAEGGTAAGTVTFSELEGGVAIIAEVSGVEPGPHGLHLHETGDCSATDFTSAGGHFDPTGVDHGGPDAEVHHAGDFGNVEIGEDGTGQLTLTTDMLTVADGEASVVGKAVILHADADDFTTQPTGNAGGRLACGVVEVAEAPEMMDTEPADGMMDAEPSDEMMETEPADDGG